MPSMSLKALAHLTFLLAASRSVTATGPVYDITTVTYPAETLACFSSVAPGGTCTASVLKTVPGQSVTEVQGLVEAEDGSGLEFTFISYISAAAPTTTTAAVEGTGSVQAPESSRTTVNVPIFTGAAHTPRAAMAAAGVVGVAGIVAAVL